MRCMLRRCAADKLSAEVARRLAIEIRTEECENEFARCVREAKWDISLLPADIAKLVN